jgi:hypothetical protein
MDYKNKYKKYKKKYLELKIQLGGDPNSVKLFDINEIVMCNRMIEALRNPEYNQYIDRYPDVAAYNERVAQLEEEQKRLGNRSGYSLDFESKLVVYNRFGFRGGMSGLIECFSRNENPSSDDDMCRAISYIEPTGSAGSAGSAEKYREVNEPVKLEYVDDWNKYVVLNGRHRVVAHIIKNVPYIYGQL